MPEKDQNIEELKRQSKELEAQIKKEEAKLKKAKKVAELSRGQEILQREYEKVKGNDLAFLNTFLPLSRIEDYPEICQYKYPEFDDVFECLKYFYRGVKNQKFEPSEVFEGVSVKDYVEFFKWKSIAMSAYVNSNREGETRYLIVKFEESGENYVWFRWFDSYSGDGGGSDRWNLCNFKERQVLELDVTLIDEDGNEEII